PISVTLQGLQGATPYATVSYIGNGAVTVSAANPGYGSLNFGAGVYTGAAGSISLAGDLTIAPAGTLIGTSLTFTGNNDSTFQAGTVNQTLTGLTLQKSLTSNHVFMAINNGATSRIVTVAGTTAIDIGTLEVQSNLVLNGDTNV